LKPTPTSFRNRENLASIATEERLCPTGNYLVPGYIHKRRIGVSSEKMFINITEQDKSFK
jgi:hypothetical protein